MNRLVVILLLLISTTIYSIELKTDFSFNNFYFDSNSEINSSVFSFEFSEIVTLEVANGLTIDAGISKDTITDYSINTDFNIQKDMFTFNIGIFTNFLNGSSKILTPGLNYGFAFTLPGITLLHLKLNNTIPNTSPLDSGVTISNYDARVGFYLGEAIVSLNIDSVSKSQGTILTSVSNISDKYFLNVDLFDKYSRYRISIDLGWNNIAKKTTALNTDGATIAGAVTGDYQAGSAYFDSDVTLLLTDYLTIDLGVLLHLIKLPIKNVSSFPTNEFNWGGRVGFTLFL